MTKQGLILIPIMGQMPDKWTYSFDGTTLTVIEEFDGADDDFMKRTLDMVSGSIPLPDVSYEGTKIIAKGDVSDLMAVASVFGEMLSQASVYGIVPIELYTQMLACVLNPPCQPVPMGSPIKVI